MDKSNLESGPRAGPRKGESRTSGATTPEVCPTYYGGGKNCFGAGQTAQSRQNDNPCENSDTILLSDVDKEKGLRSSNRGIILEFGGSSGGASDGDDRSRRSSVDRLCRAGITIEEALGGDWSFRSDSETEFSRGKRPFSELSEDEDVLVEKRLGTAKRGRVRGTDPKVSGARQALRSRMEHSREAEYVASLSKETFKKAAAEEEDREIPPGPLDLDVDAMGASELMGAAEANLQDILGIAGRSTNLKGGYASKIRRATGAIKTVLEALATRTEAEETRRLRADNARLQREVSNLREEVRAYRRDFEEAKAAAKGKRDSGSPMSNEQLGILESNIARLVGNLVDGRLSVLEKRLPPPAVERPPLASDRAAPKGVTRAPTRAGSGSSPPARDASPVLKVRAVSTPKASGPAQKRREEFSALPVRAAVRPGQVAKEGGKGGQWTNFGPSASQNVQASGGVKDVAPAASSAPEDAWTKVVKRKAPKKKQAEAGASKAPTTKGAKLFLPTSSAVVVKLRPEAVTSGETYGSVLTRAQKNINLEEMGIGPLRLRTAATGARLIEVPGRSSAPLADALAKKMGELLSEVAEVVRPVKTTEFKLTGLDETATRECINAAVAAEGGCSLTSVWVGDLHFDARGVGMVRMSCPLEAAKRLMELGSIRVGWSLVRLHHLGARPRHCYRCLGKGHMAQLCQAEKDRSGLCYRCGQPGHKMAACGSDKPHCAVCSDAGLKADHVMAGHACNPPSVHGKFPSSLRPSGRGSVVRDAEMHE